MQNKTMSRMFRLGLAGLASGSVWLAGCGVQPGSLATSAPIATPGTHVQGKVFGGQQPISGATVQLYGAGSGGYASAAYSLLSAGVVTDASGNFDITSDYTCPSSTSQVYLVATGGNSSSGTNSQIALMAALGSCGSLSGASTITINELTTVASVWSLAPFMSGYANVGATASNAQGIANAFATVNALSSISAGTVPGSLPSGATVSTTELNTLGDILAACVNSQGGTAGDGSVCGTLFSAATPVGGTAPTDTVGAAVDIAQNPSHNVSTLLGLAPPTAPFQPVETSATDFTISVRYGSVGLNTPSAAAIDSSSNIWVTNAGNNSIAEIAANGSPVSGSPFTGGGLSGPSGIAFDQNGNAWVVDKTSSKLSVFTSAGVGTQTVVVNVNAPTGIAIDGQNVLWITNSGSNSVETVTVNGRSPLTSSNYTTGINAPVAVAINPH